MLTVISDGFPLEVPGAYLLVVVLVSVAIPVVFYVLRAIGLYKLAKRKELKCAFVAWIPFLWIYVACRLVSEYRLFGMAIGKFTVLFTVLCATADLLLLVYDFLIYFPIIGNYIAGNDIYMVQSTMDVTAGMVSIWDGLGFYGAAGQFVNPYTDVFTVQKVINIIKYAQSVFALAQMIIMVTVLIYLFKKYWPQHFIIAAILSIFGLDGPFIFAIRDKEPVNYMDYLRSRYSGYGNPYGPYGTHGPYNYYGNGYNNPNAQQGAQGGAKQPESPFEDFEEKKNDKPDEPFSDF